MIKINEKGSKAINTGMNIANVLSTFIETGPKDELNAVDGYKAPSPDALSSLKGDDCGCDGPTSAMASNSGLFGGSESGGGIEFGIAGGPSGSINVPGTGGLWTALLCGRSDSSRSNLPTNRQATAVSLWMRILGCSAADILKLVDTSSGKPKLNPDVLRSRLSSALGQSLNDLKREDSDRLAASLQADQSGNDSEVEEEDSVISIGGVKKAFSAISLEDAQSFAKMLESSGGESVDIEIEDKSSKSHLQLATFDKALELNDADSFGRVIENVERTPKNRRLFATKSDAVVKSGNLKMMDHLISIVGVDILLSKNPNLLRDVIQYYVLPSGIKAPEALPELISTLSRIDSGWNLKDAYGLPQSDLEAYTWASPDAISVLMTSEEHRTQTMIAQSYRTTDKQSLINKYHDYYATTA